MCYSMMCCINVMRYHSTIHPTVTEGILHHHHFVHILPRGWWLVYDGVYNAIEILRNNLICQERKMTGKLLSSICLHNKIVSLLQGKLKNDFSRLHSLLFHNHSMRLLKNIIFEMYKKKITYFNEILSFLFNTADAGCDCGCVDSQVSRFIYYFKNIPMLSPSPHKR